MVFRLATLSDRQKKKKKRKKKDLQVHTHTDQRAAVSSPPHRPMELVFQASGPRSID